MAKQKRIMESTMSAFYVGRSKKENLRESWFWGVILTFNSKVFKSSNKKDIVNKKYNAYVRRNKFTITVSE